MDRRLYVVLAILFVLFLLANVLSCIYATKMQKLRIFPKYCGSMQRNRDQFTDRIATLSSRSRQGQDVSHLVPITCSRKLKFDTIGD
jgi:hypothetical protein